MVWRLGAVPPKTPEELRLMTAIAVERLANEQGEANTRIEHLEQFANTNQIIHKQTADDLRVLRDDFKGFRDEMRVPVTRIATILDARDKAEGAGQAGIYALLGDNRIQALILILVSGFLSWYFGGNYDHRGAVTPTPILITSPGGESP